MSSADVRVLDHFRRSGSIRAHADCTPVVDPVEVTDEELNIVVAQLRRIARSANLEFALRVGAAVIHHLYGGDTTAWYSKGPKTSSFRRLARHPALPMSPGVLCRCVALFELCERLRAPSRWENLSASHLRMVLGLPSATQERMLVEANRERWTVRMLHEAVLREKDGKVSRGGRRPQSRLAKTLKVVKRGLVEHQQAIERVDSLSIQELELSARLLEETRACLESLDQSLRSARAMMAEVCTNGSPLHPASVAHTRTNVVT